MGTIGNKRFLDLLFLGFLVEWTNRKEHNTYSEPNNTLLKRESTFVTFQESAGPTGLL